MAGRWRCRCRPCRSEGGRHSDRRTGRRHTIAYRRRGEGDLAFLGQSRKETSQSLSPGGAGVWPPRSNWLVSVAAGGPPVRRACASKISSRRARLGNRPSRWSGSLGERRASTTGGSEVLWDFHGADLGGIIEREIRNKGDRGHTQW